MWKRIGVVVIWVLAAVGTTSITLAAVSQVGGQVTEQAAGPIDSAELAAARAAAIAQTPAVTPESTVASAGSEPTATSTIAWVDVGSASTVPEAAEATSTTTTTTAPAVTPSTTAAPTTTTTPPPTTTVAPEQVTTTLIGGKVTVQRSGSNVTLVSAVPHSGFWAEVESSGPISVSVEFESESHESKYEAKVDGGLLDIQVEEHEEDGD